MVDFFIKIVGFVANLLSYILSVVLLPNARSRVLSFSFALAIGIGLFPEILNLSPLSLALARGRERKSKIQA